GKAFLGLTLGCARCHDHKFDPLPTRDYYALAGIFKSTSTMANLEHVSRWRERELALDDEKAARDAAVAAVKTAKDAVQAVGAGAEAELRGRWRRELAAYLSAGTDALRRATLVEAEDFARSNLHVDHDMWGSPKVGIVHTQAGGLQFAEYELELAAGGWYE